MELIDNNLTMDDAAEVVELTSQQKYSQGLREVADFYDAHPDLDVPYIDIITVYGIAGEKLRTFAKAFGKAEKTTDDYSFQLVKTFPSGQRLRTYTDRANVCKRVKVSEELVPSYTVPATPEKIVEEHVREVFAWECPESILAPSEGVEDAD